jgi:hypothetical protein
MHEDISDVITQNSRVETPFLDYLGDSPYAAKNTTHEWGEDDVLAESDLMNDSGGISNSDTSMVVTDGTKFLAGSVIQIDSEIILVTAVSTNTLTISRNYGGKTAAAAHDDASTIHIIAHVALEGDDAPTANHTARSRVSNYCQIITPHQVNVSGTQQAVSLIGVKNEFDHQMRQRAVEGMRMLERSVIGGTKAASTPAGSSTVRRTMQGLKWFCSTNTYAESSAVLTEARLLAILQDAWSSGMYAPDFILVGAKQKAKISGFKRALNSIPQESTNSVVRTDFFESDFGRQQVILDRWVFPGELIIGTSKWINVMPLQGRSFQMERLAKTGDADKGMVVGEYTLEVKHEEAHAYVSGLG